MGPSRIQNSIFVKAKFDQREFNSKSQPFKKKKIVSPEAPTLRYLNVHIYIYIRTKKSVNFKRGI